MDDPVYYRKGTTDTNRFICTETSGAEATLFNATALYARATIQSNTPTPFVEFPAKWEGGGVVSVTVHPEQTELLPTGMYNVQILAWIGGTYRTYPRQAGSYFRAELVDK